VVVLVPTVLAPMVGPHEPALPVVALSVDGGGGGPS
jgi:hypothetical protein